MLLPCGVRVRHPLMLGDTENCTTRVKCVYAHIWLPAAYTTPSKREKNKPSLRLCLPFLTLSLHLFLSVFGLIFIIFAASSFLFLRISGRPFGIVVKAKAAFDYHER